jgi:hypothetical protein
LSSKKQFLVAAVASLLCACGGGDSNPSHAGAAQLPVSPADALAALETDAPSGYSLTFFGESPGVTGLRAMAILGGQGDVCADYKDHFASAVPATSPLWILQLYFTGTEPGDYAIAVNPPLPSATPLVSVTLERWDNGRRSDSFVALGGSVSLKASARDQSSWQAGLDLEATVHAEFPQHHVRALGCDVSGAVNGPSTSVCQCEDDSMKFTCTPSEDNPACCFDYESERYAETINLDASRCADMCDVTSLLYQQRCTALQSGK